MENLRGADAGGASAAERAAQHPLLRYRHLPGRWILRGLPLSHGGSRSLVVILFSLLNH